MSTADSIFILSGPTPDRLFLGGLVCFEVQATISGDSGLQDYSLTVEFDQVIEILIVILR